VERIHIQRSAASSSQSAVTTVSERIALVVLPVVVLTTAGLLLFSDRAATDATLEPNRVVALVPARAGRAIEANAPVASTAQSFSNSESSASVGVDADDAAVSGMVTDPEGAPVHGAKVRVNVRSNMLDGRGKSLLPQSSALVVETDQSGRYRFASAPFFVYEILISAAGFGTESVRARSGSWLDTTLRRTAILEGTVVDVLARPISGATFRLMQGDQVRVAHSASNGQWNFDEVVAGSAWLEVAHPDYEPRAIRVVGLSDGAVESRQITLVRGATVLGDVRTAAGVPVIGAQVEITSITHGLVCGHYTTNAEGRFEGHTLVPGERYRVTALHQLGQGRSEVMLAENLDRTFTTVVIAPTWTLSGTVTGPSPSVAAYAHLAVTSEDGTANPEVIATAEGAFSVPGLMAGVNYRLVASAPGMAITQLSGVNQSKPIVQVELEPAVTAAGRVLSAQGVPLESALVKFNLPNQGGAAVLTWTDAAGHWQVQGLPSGEAWMTVSHPGFQNHVTQESFAAPARGALIITSLTPLL
jgi:protocatechuate 3,4-dioxygenase beta subunit